MFACRTDNKGRDQLTSVSCWQHQQCLRSQRLLLLVVQPQLRPTSAGGKRKKAAAAEESPEEYVDLAGSSSSDEEQRAEPAEAAEELSQPPSVSRAVLQLGPGGQQRSGEGAVVTGCAAYAQAAHCLRTRSCFSVPHRLGVSLCEHAQLGAPGTPASLPSMCCPLACTACLCRARDPGERQRAQQPRSSASSPTRRRRRTRRSRAAAVPRGPVRAAAAGRLRRAAAPRGRRMHRRGRKSPVEGVLTMSRRSEGRPRGWHDLADEVRHSVYLLARLPLALNCGGRLKHVTWRT